MFSGSDAGSYLRLIDSCITQLKAQGPFRNCNESKEEEVAVAEAEGVDRVLDLHHRAARMPATQGGNHLGHSKFY